MDRQQQQQQQQQQDGDQELVELDPTTQLEGFFREDGSYVQIMPDGQQFVYMADGQMGYLEQDGTFNPISAEFGITDDLNQQQAQQQQNQQQNQPQNQGFDVATTSAGVMPTMNSTSSASGSSYAASPDPNYPQQPSATAAASSSNYQFQQPQQQQQQDYYNQQQQQQQQPPSSFQPSTSVAKQYEVPTPNYQQHQQQQQQQEQQDAFKSNNNRSSQLQRQENQPEHEQQQQEQKPQIPEANLPPLFESELRFGYWPNLIIELFCSTAFKLYFCILLWDSAVIIFFLGLDWMFGALARVYHPPEHDNADWQSMGFLGILVVISMLVATLLTLVLQLIKEMWRLKQTDTVFWGFTNSSIQYQALCEFVSCCCPGPASFASTRVVSASPPAATPSASNRAATPSASAAAVSAAAAGGGGGGGGDSQQQAQPQQQVPVFPYLDTAAAISPFFNVASIASQQAQQQQQQQSGSGSAATADAPPYFVYLCILILVTILPFLWSVGLTADSDLSGMYFAQFFCYIIHIITLFIIAAVYVWWYILSLRAKYEAYVFRGTDPMDDEDEEDPAIILRRQQESSQEGAVSQRLQQLLSERDQDQQNQQQTQSQPSFQSFSAIERDREIEELQKQQREISGRPWFRSPALLSEFGLDRRSISWSVFTFIFGFVGVLVVGTILATQGTNPSLSAAWVVALVAFVAILAAMVVLSGRGKRISIYTNLFFIVLFFVLAMVGCGATSYKGTFSLFLVPIFLMQGMFLRKREHSMRKHEIILAFGGTVEEVEATANDSYIVVGKRSIAALLSYCVNVRNLFGVRHPRVLEADRELRRLRASLFMDLRVLFYYWLAFWLMLIAVASFSSTLPWPAISTPQSLPIDLSSATTTTTTTTSAPSSATTTTMSSLLAATVSQGVTLAGTPLPMCQYAAGFNNSFSLYDLSLMALLAESAESGFATDFARWFGNRSIALRPNPDITQRFPAPNARQPEFLDFYNTQSGAHAIVVRAAANRGGTLLRNLDMVGDSVALQMASVFAPVLSAWPLKEKRRFVRGVADVKLVASNTNVTGDIDAYLKSVKDSGETAVVVGFGFNGVIASIAASAAGVPVVSFNSPGTSLLADKYDVDTPSARNARRHALHIRTSQSLVGVMGEQDDLGTTHVLSCTTTNAFVASDFSCDNIPLIAGTIGDLCGDPEYGRLVNK